MIPPAFAEGFASITTVTAANGKNLDHHRLAVSCKSQNGKAFVHLVFRPNDNTPFTNCSVTIYDDKGKNILVEFNPLIDEATTEKGLPAGRSIRFHVADELVDRIEIRYYLHANDYQSHAFTIGRGELKKLAKLAQ